MGHWRRRVAAATLVAVAGMVGGASAAPLRFTDFYAFGDSLSDDGNLYAATEGAVPGEPYFEGRFSNGPVWTEYVAADFASKGRTTENYAYGEARVGPNARPVLNLGGQIDAFAARAADDLGARPVASMWIGANDLFAGVAAGEARAAGRAAANGAAAGARALRKLGVRDLMLFNMPALDRTPFFTLVDPAGAEQAQAATLAYNRTLARRATDLRASGMNVIEFDMFGLFDALLDDPGAYGLLDATTPCYIPGVFDCGDELAPFFAFFDPVHPSSTVHAAIADVVRAEVAPVPLPAPAGLLVIGVLALGAAARARGSHRA